MDGDTLFCRSWSIMAIAGGTLTILFSILQRCGVIFWDWVFVFLPVIIPAGLLFIMMAMVLGVVIWSACEVNKETRKELKQLERKNRKDSN